jgi:hypothetical protein
MKAGKLDLPVIWRGTDYTSILMVWKDKNGHPFDLTDWTPLAQSLNINLHPEIVDPVSGTTKISIPKEETSGFRLGREPWDWLWRQISTDLIYGPYISGTLTIKDPTTNAG